MHTHMPCLSLTHVLPALQKPAAVKKIVAYMTDVKEEDHDLFREKFGNIFDIKNGPRPASTSMPKLIGSRQTAVPDLDRCPKFTNELEMTTLDGLQFQAAAKPFVIYGDPEAAPHEGTSEEPPEESAVENAEQRELSAARLKRVEKVLTNKAEKSALAMVAKTARAEAKAATAKVAAEKKVQLSPPSPSPHDVSPSCPTSKTFSTTASS